MLLNVLLASSPERLSIEVKAMLTLLRSSSPRRSAAAVGRGRACRRGLRRIMVSRDAKRTLSDQLLS
jgi:hypothetical protein